MTAQENWLHGENTTTVPVSVRFPAGDAYKLYLYAEQMNTSPGKLLARLLDDYMAGVHRGRRYSYASCVKSLQEDAKCR